MKESMDMQTEQNRQQFVPAPDAKTPSASYTEQVHIVNHADLNGYKRLFGGRLLSWMDITAGFVARRHAGANVTTVAIDDLRFIEPAYANDMIVMCGKVTYTGRTSMEVRVQTFVEDVDGTRRLINDAFFVMVALDENEKPKVVPPLWPQSEEEMLQVLLGQKRQEARKQRAQRDG